VRPVRAALFVALLGLAPLALVTPAVAGGPTSALICVPGAGRTASLYYTDAEYAALAELVAVDGDTGSDEDIVPEADGPVITVTWLIHDVTPWRLDQVQLDREGRVWIATNLDNGSGDIWNAPSIWHRPDDPDRLLAFLGDLGVGFTATRGSKTDRSPSSTVTATPPARTAVPEATAGQDASPVSLPSLGGGLLMGLAGGALLMGLWTRRRGSTEPVPARAEGPEDRLSWRA